MSDDLPVNEWDSLLDQVGPSGETLRERIESISVEELTQTTRALTLHQPWASLIAVGAKTIETRSWSTKHRGRLLIHAGVAWEPWTDDKQALAQHLFKPDGPGVFKVPTTPAIPRGAVVASCTLTDCVPIVAYDTACATDLVDLPYPRIETRVGPSWAPDGELWLYHPTLGDPIEPENGGRLIAGEAPFGDFSPGRWAWLLEDVQPIVPPIPAKGRQGLWWWTP